MSFKFEVGQEVIRIDSVTGAPWGAPVTISHRTVLVLPAHNICEKRYVFKDSGYSCEFPESALRAMDVAVATPQDMPPGLLTAFTGLRFSNSIPNSEQRFPRLAAKISAAGGFTPKSKLSWWEWLFHD